MSGSDGISLRSTYSLAAMAFVLAGCSSLAGAPAPPQAPAAGALNAPAGMQAARPAQSSQDLYIANILGGVPLYSTGKNPQEVGDITDQLPRVTGVWVDAKGVLYAYSDNRQNPYETIEEFKPGATSPFFSLVVQHYGFFAVADAAQNVYAQGENGQARQVIDEYPQGSQNLSHEYVVPSIGTCSGPTSMAFDPTGALLVGVAALANNKHGEIGAVFRLNAASSTFTNLNLKNDFGGAIATDGVGNVFVGGGDLVSVYAPGATNPSRVIHTKSQITAITAASNGTLYVQTYSEGITVYAPGRVRSNESFIPRAQVSALALGPG